MTYACCLQRVARLQSNAVVFGFMPAKDDKEGSR